MRQFEENRLLSMAISTLTKGRSPLFHTPFWFFPAWVHSLPESHPAGSACSCGNRSRHPYVCLFSRLRAVCSEAILILPASVIYHEQDCVKTLSSPERARSPLAVPKMYHRSGQLPLQGSFFLHWPRLQKTHSLYIVVIYLTETKIPRFPALERRKHMLCIIFLIPCLFCQML